MNGFDDEHWMGDSDDLQPQGDNRMGEDLPHSKTPPPPAKVAARSAKAKETAQDTPPLEEPVSVAELADRFSKAVGAIYLANVVRPVLIGLADAQMMMEYLAGLIEECGAQYDPLQRMLLEQITICYHRLGALHISSATAKTPEAMVQYNSAAARLFGELRKSLLAMRELQSLPMSTGTSRRVLAAVTPPLVDPRFVTKQGSKTAAVTAPEAQNAKQQSAGRNGKESETSGGGPTKSPEATGLHHGRTAEIKNRSTTEPALAGVHGTANRSW